MKKLFGFLVMVLFLGVGINSISIQNVQAKVINDFPEGKSTILIDTENTIVMANRGTKLSIFSVNKKTGDISLLDDLTNIYVSEDKSKVYVATFQNQVVSLDVKTLEETAIFNRLIEEPTICGEFNGDLIISLSGYPIMVNESKDTATFIGCISGYVFDEKAKAIVFVDTEGFISYYTKDRGIIYTGYLASRIISSDNLVVTYKIDDTIYTENICG